MTETKRFNLSWEIFVNYSFIGVGFFFFLLLRTVYLKIIVRVVIYYNKMHKRDIWPLLLSPWISNGKVCTLENVKTSLSLLVRRRVFLSTIVTLLSENPELFKYLNNNDISRYSVVDKAMDNGLFIIRKAPAPDIGTAACMHAMRRTRAMSHVTRNGGGILARTASLVLWP